MRPIYKASFSIGKEDKKPKLESVIETARFWASEKLPGNPLADFGKGISLEDSKGDLKTVFVDEGETRHFGMTFGHPDIVNPDFRWEVRFAAREEQNKPHTIGISLSNGWKGNLIMPAQTEITRPALVSRLVDQFHSYEGYYPLNITPVMIGSGKISALVANIFDKKRNLPIVCVSWKNLTDKPIANANKISSYLAGIAHTCIINRHATFELADQAGKSLSCFNGAVRIYWPVGNVNPASIMHPFWTPLEISAAGDKFPQKVLETIAKFSIGRSLPVSYEDVKMREALGKIRRAKIPLNSRKLSDYMKKIKQPCKSRAKKETSK